MLCFSLGLQWAALQGIAWTGMLIRFSQEISLVEAVGKTFDGEHRCALCKAVEDGQKKASDTPVGDQKIKKLDAVPFQIFVITPPVVRAISFPILIQKGFKGLVTPPWLPPRSAHA